MQREESVRKKEQRVTGQKPRDSCETIRGKGRETERERRRAESGRKRQRERERERKAE
jgi:hypothetical protein